MPNIEDTITVQVPAFEIEEFMDPNGFVTRAKYLYKIRDKDGKLISYRPWKPQQILDRIIREERKRSLETLGRAQVLLMYLKSRQEGLSTDTTLRMTDRMLYNDSYQAQVLAHDQEGTGLLYSQYERAFNNLPHKVQVVDHEGRPITDKGELWEFPIRPKGGPTRRGIKYKNLSESNLIVQTAGKGDNAGKAGSLNAVHFSETANYSKHDKVISSVNQQLGGTDIFGVKESTANGTTDIGEGFYNDWVSEEKAWARFQSGEESMFTGWRPVFIPWYWLYSMELVNGEMFGLSGVEWSSEKEKQEYLEWEEKLVEDIIPNDPEMDENERDPKEYVNFYRWVIVNKCQRKLSDARRYYPTSPEEAFTTSDKCFFSTNKLFVVKSDVKSLENEGLNCKTGYLNEKGEFVEKNGGELKVKRFPDNDWLYRYVVSCDQSKGYEDGDFSYMSVFDRLERDFIMYWQGLIPEDQLAVELTKLGYFNNKALLVPESNRMTVINLIKPDGHERYMGEIYYNKETMRSRSRREPEWGYHTGSTSRKILIDKLLSYMEPDEHEQKLHEDLGNYPALFTEEAINEYLHFIRNANGQTTKYEAAQGYKDDIVIGDALCLIGDEWWERSPQRKPKAGRKKGKTLMDLSTSTRRRPRSGVDMRQGSLGKGKRKRGNSVRVTVGGKQSQLGK